MVPSHHICRVARSERSNRLSTPPPLPGLKIRGIKTFLYCSIYSKQKCWPPWPTSPPLPRYKYTGNIYMFSYKKHRVPSPPPPQQKTLENFLSDVNNIFTWSCRVLGVGEVEDMPQVPLFTRPAQRNLSDFYLLSYFPLSWGIPVSFM